MVTPPPITRMTSKQAKKAYKKRGGQPQLTDLQKRQIARSVELDRRAQAIREKEQRKKDNARKRAEKEEKHRETRRKMGIAEPVDEGYVSPRQTRMDGFFRRPTINTSLAAAVKETTDNEAQTDEADSDDAASIQEKPHADGEDLEDLVSSDDEVDVNGSDAEIEIVEGNGVDGQEDHTAKEPALQGMTLEPIRIKRKREALSRASSGISCYSQPVRMPLRLMDSNLFIDKRELWVPPSQNVIGQGKHAVMAPLRNEPFPDLPFPKPESTDRPASPDTETSASQREEGGQVIERTTSRVPLLDDDVPLPSQRRNEVKASSVENTDKEMLELAALFSSDSFFDIDELPPQALHLQTVPSTDIHQNPVTRDGQGQFNVDDMLAGLSASQFSSPLDLYHPSEPPLPAVRRTETATEQVNEGKVPDSDMMPLTDALDISVEDAEALEHAAMRILNKEDELAAPRERNDASAQQIAEEADEQLPTRQTESKPAQHQGTGIGISRSANPAEKPNALSTSFGFGDFDFSSQDIDRFQK